MAFPPLQFRYWLNRNLPPGTPGRKVVEIISIILLVEGMSVLLLFSYVGLHIGLVSTVAGALLLLLLRENGEIALSESETPGVKLVDSVFRLVGGEYPMMFLGAAVVGAVLVYNWLSSPSPDIGDSDRLSILLGMTVMLYPLSRNRYRVEASFAIIFIGGVVALLVVPRVLASLSGTEGSSEVGDWYVHYMLAAPFAWILDSVGIPASSLGSLVTIQFQDGSIHTLGISAYCAGLYSFSIFLSAFVAFVLVFEKFPARIMGAVLAAGLLVAYMGNLLRMVIIGVVGYYEGIEALHWTHENAGWVIFLAWSALFWWLILGYSSKIKTRARTEDD